MRLGRECYRPISLYAPDRTPCDVDLSDNTNLFGVPPAAERAVRQAALASFTRYPAVYANELKRELARYVGVAPEQVVTGCGSDDVLDSALRAFAEPGERLAFPEPSFAMMPLFSRMNGLEPVAVPLRPDFSLDVDALVRTEAKVIYVCSPNNPTGHTAARGELERLLERAPGVVLLDEAYAEFADDTWVAEAPNRERLVVVRTLSKAFGLAGLRVGYAVGPEPLVVEVEKSRGPYKVSAVAERAALAALEGDIGWVRARVAEVRENRVRLARALTSRGFAPLPSSANFVLVPVPDAKGLTRALRERGVAVRPFEGLCGVGDAIRVSVGPWPMLERFLDALAEVCR